MHPPDQSGGKRKRKPVERQKWMESPGRSRMLRPGGSLLEKTGQEEKSDEGVFKKEED